MSKTTPTAPTTSAVGPCPTIIQIDRTSRHRKFTQHHRTTQLYFSSTKFNNTISWANKVAPDKMHLIYVTVLSGRSGGAMVLGKLSVPGRPTNLD